MRRAMAPLKAPFSCPKLGLDQTRRQRGAVDLDQRLVVPAAVRMDRARDELLARAGLPRDQHGRVGRGHAPRLFEHRDQARGAPHDLLEVVDRLDLLPQVAVLLLQARLLLFQEDALGDVHEHRARVGAAGIGLRPPLDPERLLVVLAAQLEHYTARVRPAADGVEGLLQPALVLGVVDHEGLPVGALHLLRLDPERSQGRTVGADEARVEPLVHVGDRGLLEEVAQALLALTQRALDRAPFELGCRVRGEDAQQRLLLRIEGQGPASEGGHVTEHAPVRPGAGETDVAFDRVAREQCVPGEFAPRSAWDQDELAGRQRGRGRSREVPFEVRLDSLRSAQGQGAHTLPRLRLGHARVLHGEDLGQARDQSAEAFLAGSLESRRDLAEHASLVRIGGDRTSDIGRHEGMTAREATILSARPGWQGGKTTREMQDSAGRDGMPIEAISVEAKKNRGDAEDARRDTVRRSWG
jgi:hypothetical protein